MLELRVLGAFEAYDGARALELGGPRQRSVLALLAVARGKVVPVDRIVEDLWRSEPPPRAMAALQTYVSHLRRALEPDRPARAPAQVLVSAAPGYALRLDTEQVDAWHFEQLARRGMALVDSDPAAAKPLLDAALRLHRGAAYGQFADEDWAAPEAARLDELRVVTVEQRASAALGIGMAAAAVPDLEVHAAAHPLREEAWRLLAIALYRSGRQADALAVLRRVRATLAEELGIDPGPALRRLEADMLAHAPELDGPATGPVSLAGPVYAEQVDADARDASAAGGAVERGAVQIGAVQIGAVQIGAAEIGAVEQGAVEHGAVELRAVEHGAAERGAVRGDPALPAEQPPDDAFVGRHDELAALCAAAADARAGSGGVALVAGDPGAGKSALAEALDARLAAEGWVVGWGRCPEGEGAPSAWPWTELLRSLAAQVPPSDDVAARLAPLLDDSAATQSGDVAAARFRLYGAVGAYLREIAAQAPLLIVLDDVHRADQDSLALWTRISGCVCASRSLVVATYRPAEVSDRLTEALATVARHEPLRLALGGLSGDEVSALVRATAGAGRELDAAALSLIASRTGGNPFFVREMARLVASEGGLDPATEVPAGVRDVLRRRLARLPARSQTVLRLASVLGRDIDVDVLVRSASDNSVADEDEVLDALDAGIVAGLLRESAGGALRFSHVLVRDALYDDISQLRRVRLHGRVAQTIEAVRPGNLDELAHHYTAAAATPSPSPEIVEQALRCTIGAARQALARFSHADAVTLLERGIALSERLGGGVTTQRVELLIELVAARTYGGNGMGARVARSEAIRLARTLDDADLLLRAVASWTVPTSWTLRRYAQIDDDLVSYLDEALEVAPPGDNPLRCRLLYSVVAELEGGDAFERTTRAADECLAMARRLGHPELLALGLNAQYFASWSRPGVVDRGPIARELLELGAAHDLILAQVLGHQVATQAAGAIGDMDAVRRHAQAAITLTETYDLRGAAAVSHLALALDRLVAGDYDVAEAMYRTVVEAMVAAGAYNAEEIGWLATYVVAELRGDDLAPLHDVVADMYGEYPDQVADVYVRVLLALGRASEARLIWSVDRPIRADYFQVMLLVLRAATAVQLGDSAAAATLYERLQPFSGQLGGGACGSFSLWPVDTVLGDLAASLGRPAEARRHYSAGLEVSRRAGSRPFEAQAAAALARLASIPSPRPTTTEPARRPS